VAERFSYNRDALGNASAEQAWTGPDTAEAVRDRSRHPTDALAADGAEPGAGGDGHHDHARIAGDERLGDHRRREVAPGGSRGPDRDHQGAEQRPRERDRAGRRGDREARGVAGGDVERQGTPRVGAQPSAEGLTAAANALSRLKTVWVEGT